MKHTSAIFCLFIRLSFEKASASTHAETSLFEDMFQSYNNWVRPVAQFSSTLNLSYRASLYQLVDFDSKKETITTMVWQSVCWYDEFLSWSPEEYDGVNKLRVPQEKVWTPDLLPYNDVGIFDNTKYRLVVPVTVHFDGRVCWAIPITMETICKMDVKKFPFDKQVCVITIGSWQYNAYEVDIFCTDSELSTDNYVSHVQWELEGTNCYRTVDQYTTGKYTSIHFSLEYKRLPGFYVRNLLLPNALLLSLSGLIFFLPCEGGERVGFGITVTLALCVNLVIVIEFIPETSKTIPEICDYFLVSISLSGCSLLLATLVLNLYTYSWEVDPDKQERKDNLRSIFNKLCSVKRALKASSTKIIAVENVEKHNISSSVNKSVNENIHREETMTKNRKDVNEWVKRADKLIGVFYITLTSLFTIIFLADMANKSKE